MQKTVIRHNHPGRQAADRKQRDKRKRDKRGLLVQKHTGNISFGHQLDETLLASDLNITFVEIPFTT